MAGSVLRKSAEERQVTLPLPVSIIRVRRYYRRSDFSIATLWQSGRWSARRAKEPNGRSRFLSCCRGPRVGQTWATDGPRAGRTTKPTRAGLRKCASAPTNCGCGLRGQDLNLRPLGYEPNELPGCSTPRSRADSNMERCLFDLRDRLCPEWRRSVLRSEIRSPVRREPRALARRKRLCRAGRTGQSA